MNEETIDLIITNIKVISQLKPNDKLCIRKGHLYIDTSSNFQFLKRWFYCDSRDLVLIYMNTLVLNVRNILEKCVEYTKTDRLWILTRILTELENASDGLVNLIRTYNLDPYMIANIENVSLKFKELAQIGRNCLIT
jgi:hypothetical protein